MRDRLVRDVLREVGRLSRLSNRLSLFGFGSFFTGEGVYRDIDLLIVCETSEHTELIRMELATLCRRWPIHLMIMTEDEERETAFVSSQDCKRLMSVLGSE